MRSLFALLALVACAGTAHAQTAPGQTVPGQTVPGQGGSLPLSEVLDVAKPYPNLVTQVRLRLLASNTTKDKVTCSGERFPNTWTALGGARFAPYICPIGKRTLTITAEPTFYDKAGYKLKPNDPALPAKAAKLVESRLKWSWK